ncbi:MAG: hypothetical protein AABN34_09030 [Acidobacteriota bacterium]
MNKASLRDAVNKLTEIAFAKHNAIFSYEQAACQYNSLLERAKELYQERVDIQSMRQYEQPDRVPPDVLENAILRLKSALDLSASNSSIELLARVKLPSDAPGDVALDFNELEEAVDLGLQKTVLLLTGSIAESLLLVRHPDKSERGPGLSKLVQQARDQRLFGRDTLRNLEMLVEYRDLIHPRAESRNQTFRNLARVDSAISALKLLCYELEDTSVRYI